MLCAPVVGLMVGVVAAATGLVLLLLGAGPLLAAVASVAVLKPALTRGCTWTGWPTPPTDWAAAGPPRTRCGS